MLCVIRRSLSVLPPYRSSTRRNVVSFSRTYHPKVSAVPFVLSKDEAVRYAAASGKGLAPSLAKKSLPDFESKSLQPPEVKAFYLPVWFIDGEVTGNVTKSGTEVSTTIQSLNSYMPGFSLDPLSTLSLSKPNFEEFAIPFTPELRHQLGNDISCLPFSISPIPLLNIINSSSPSQTELPDSMTLDPKSVDISMLAAYPVLLPIYALRYHSEETSEVFTCVLRAHSKYEPGSPLLDVPPRKFPPSSPLDKFADPVDDISPWHVHCAWSGSSTIAIPIAYPGLDWFNGGISEWIDKKIRSKSDMAALAKYGVDMDHPCVRTFTKEEVDANRKFLAVSAKNMRVLARLEGVQSEGVRLEADGEIYDLPLAVIEYLRETMPVTRDKLKPLWLQDFQASQGRGGAPL